MRILWTLRRCQCPVSILLLSVDVSVHCWFLPQTAVTKLRADENLLFLPFPLCSPVFSSKFWSLTTDPTPKGAQIPGSRTLSDARLPPAAQSAHTAGKATFAARWPCVPALGPHRPPFPSLFHHFPHRPSRLRDPSRPQTTTLPWVDIQSADPRLPLAGSSPRIVKPGRPLIGARERPGLREQSPGGRGGAACLGMRRLGRSRGEGTGQSGRTRGLWPGSRPPLPSPACSPSDLSPLSCSLSPRRTL